jgi:hypothetical protein
MSKAVNAAVFTNSDLKRIADLQPVSKNRTSWTLRVDTALDPDDPRKELVAGATAQNVYDAILHVTDIKRAQDDKPEWFIERPLYQSEEVVSFDIELPPEAARTLLQHVRSVKGKSLPSEKGFDLSALEI